MDFEIGMTLWLALAAAYAWSAWSLYRQLKFVPHQERLSRKAAFALESGEVTAAARRPGGVNGTDTCPVSATS